MTASIQQVNQLDGTSLPRLNTDAIEAMIHRDSLAILGLDVRTDR